MAKKRQSSKAVKAPLHEGAHGAGAISKSKFNKDTRDEVGEKEAGKSRGAGG